MLVLYDTMINGKLFLREQTAILSCRCGTIKDRMQPCTLKLNDGKVMSCYNYFADRSDFTISEFRIIAVLSFVMPPAILLLHIEMEAKHVFSTFIFYKEYIL